jgi:tol-pal system protein YbgF
MRGEINQLKRDSFELKKETSELRKQTSGSVREDSFNAIRESQASLYSQVNEQSKELQVLRGRFDEYKFFMDKAMKESATERELLRTQISALETRVKELTERLPRTGEPRTSGTEQKPAEEENGEKSLEPKKAEENTAAAMYESAYNSFKGKKFKDAREKFSAFIKKFPKDSLVGNAHFWTGESYFAEKDFENAILAYETVIKSYPQNVKIPGALYKQGLSFMELGDKKTAKVIFEKLLEKYPDSPEATQAKKKKAEIEKKPVKKGTR